MKVDGVATRSAHRGNLLTRFYEFADRHRDLVEMSVEGVPTAETGAVKDEGVVAPRAGVTGGDDLSCGRGEDAVACVIWVGFDTINKGNPIDIKSIMSPHPNVVILFTLTSAMMVHLAPAAIAAPAASIVLCRCSKPLRHLVTTCLELLNRVRQGGETNALWRCGRHWRPGITADRRAHVEIVIRLARDRVAEVVHQRELLVCDQSAPSAPVGLRRVVVDRCGQKDGQPDRCNEP